MRAVEGDERRGILMLLGGALAFSAMSVLVKRAGQELPVAMLVLARGAVTLVIGYATLRSRRLSPWGNDHKALALRGVFGLGGLACFFYALTVLPLAEVTVLFYLNPVFTALLAVILLGEALDRRLVAALGLSVAGTLLVVRPAAFFDHHTALPAAGVVAALAGAVFSAFAYTTVRRLTRTEKPDVIVFYFSLVATPATLPFAIAAWEPPTATGWMLLLGIGVATQLGQLGLTHGLSRVPAGRGTTVGYVQIVFATLWGLLLFDERLTVWAGLGAALIVVAVASLFARGAPGAGPTPKAAIRDPAS